MSSSNLGISLIFFNSGELKLFSFNFPFSGFLLLVTNFRFFFNFPETRKKVFCNFKIYFEENCRSLLR